jgi:hypothetical protein
MGRYLALVAGVLVAAIPARAVDVTLCDQVVPAGQVGDVVADLDCQSNAFGAAVHLDQNATLRLNGHRIAGPTGGGNVIEIPLSGRIEGPGEIAGPAVDALGACVSADGAMLTVNGGDPGIDIHGCQAGINVVNGKAKLANVSLHDNVGPGAFALRLQATNVSATRNGAQGLNADNLKAVNVTASGNGLFGFGGRRVLVLGGTADGNGRFGISSLDGHVTAHDLTITASGEVGVLGGGTTKIVLKDSSVTGTGPGAGIFPPNTDILAVVKRPMLVSSVCGKSVGPAGTWGICQND